MRYDFDVIALSETWNPANANNLFLPKHIEGYHDYVGTTGSSLKGGCGFYIKDNLSPVV